MYKQHLCRSISIINGLFIEPHNDQLSVSLKAKLVQHCISIHKTAGGSVGSASDLSAGDCGMKTWVGATHRVLNGDIVFDAVNPFLSKGFPIDE